MKWKTAIGCLLLALFLRRVWLMCLLLQPWKVVFNHSPGPCHLVPPVANGSEGIHLLPGGKALMTTGIKLPTFERNPRIMRSPGHVLVFDFRSPRGGASVVPCDNFPGYGTERFAPHGISAVQHKGETLVFIVNHPDGGYTHDTVEKFTYDVNAQRLHHVKTYTTQHFRVLNDIVATGPESFYVTNWVYFRPRGLAQIETVLLQLHWSNLLHYDNGQPITVADGFLMANGVAISHDQRYLYVYTLGTQSIHVYERDKQGSLTLVQTKLLPTMTCDSLDVEEESEDLWVACHPVPYRTLQYMGEPDENRLTAPSQILRIRTSGGLLTDDVTSVYGNDGSEFQASAVAVFHRATGGLLIGSMDKTLLYCHVKHV